jgi:DNA ligase-1
VAKLLRRKFKRLYKLASDKKSIVEWDICAYQNKDGTATIETTYGQRDGKKQTIKEIIKEGKNVGKKNETSPYEQAVNEARGKWNTKKDRNRYSLTIAASGEKRAIAPMLALVFEDHAGKVDWSSAVVQPKLDGFRCLARKVTADEVTLESREGKPITTMPHIVADLVELMVVGEVWDGELYIHGEKFQKIASLIKKNQKGSEGVKYHVYDNPTHSDKPFYKRISQISGGGKWQKYSTLNMVWPRAVLNVDEMHELQREYIGAGYEGAMLRHGDAGYEFGKRSQSLLKVKTFKDAEFEIVNCREGKGKSAGTCVFICKAPSGAEFEVYAPGTVEEKAQIWKNRKKYMGKKLTVKYQEMSTSEKPVPRFPVALRFYEKL